MRKSTKLNECQWIGKEDKIRKLEGPFRANRKREEILKKN